METKINIAEILKDKPQGTKLYSSACGKCKLIDVDDKSFKISFYSSKFGFMNGGEGYLDKFGKLYDDGECVIFPSREMRDWSKFAWKKGDVLVSNNGKVKVIFDKFRSDTYSSFIGKYHIDSLECNNPYYQYEGEYATGSFKLEEVDAVQTYINTIEERLGGKLNRETLEIEPAKSEFKDGDILFYKSAKLTFFSSIFILDTSRNEMRSYVRFSIRKGSIDYDMPVYNLNTDRFRYATEEEKQQLFDALEKEGKAWDAEKKMLVDLPKKCEFKPFDKVLIRDFKDQAWQVSLFGYKDANNYYCCNGSCWNHCIPYKGNESLLGTTKDVEDYI